MNNHMDRPLVLAGFVLGTAVALTGCGGGKQVPTSPSPGGTRQYQRPPAPRASVVPGVVTVGRFCGTAGTVGKTSSGAWARCLKRGSDKRPRWYPQGPAPRSRVVRQGEFCAPAGSTAKSSSGTKLVCKKKRGEDRPRWRVK